MSRGLGDVYKRQGLKGSGKTKRLVEMVATAVREESGSVVCIEKDKKLTYDIPYQARLIYACDYAYAMGSYDFFKGFLSGLHAGNYDITELFLDGILRITDHDMAAAAKVLNAIDKITSNIEVVVTVSADAADLPEDLKKFVI